MALSQDEQRMLAEIERRLAADDPGLASCLTTFRRPGPGAVLRSPRARIIGSLFTVLLVAMVSLMVYAMIPFRTHMPRHPPPPTAGAPAHTSVSAVTSSQPDNNQQSAASASTSPTATTTTQNVTNGASTSAVTAKPQPTPAKPTSVAVPPGANP